jgi:DNA-binding transcriptional regulator YiaG
MTDTVGQIKATMARHELTPEEMAIYLGVPVHTLLKWLNGTRTPTASAVRLVEVLGIIETMAPMIHDHLLP